MPPARAMSWITLLWAMVASACLTLAAVQLPVWLRDRSARPNAFFAMQCISSAGLAFCELKMMHAPSTDAYASAMRLGHVMVLGMSVAAIGFVGSYFKTGRAWLGWTAIGLRTASLLPNFLTGVSLNFLAITALEPVLFLGETVLVAKGTPNPWMVLSQLASLLLVVFVIDASIAAWRQGQRRIALTVGGGVVCLSLLGLVQAVLVFWGWLRMPITISVLSLGVVLAMAYEMSREVLRATRLARELHESQERMSLAAEAADLGIWMLDLTRNSLWTSARTRSLFGFSQAQSPDLEMLLQRVDADDRDGVRKAFSQAAQARGGYNTEFRVRLPDDASRARWIAVQGRVELDEKKRPVRMRGACSDVTLRKENDQQMLQLRLEVAHAGRVSAMGQMAASLAHEINQPLGAIMRNTEAALMLMRSEPMDLAEIRAILGDILADDQRAGAVIDRMRAMLRRSELEIRKLAVDSLLSEVAALVRPDAAARHVRLMLDIEDGLPAVMGDSVHLQQVLLNLISNGMDAIDEASRKVRDIAVSAARRGARIVEIAVNDSGPGIPGERLEQVFGSFYTTKASGLGMGLSISRSLIEAHGGRLWAENIAGGGASLRFTLPVPAPESS